MGCTKLRVPERSYDAFSLEGAALTFFYAHSVCPLVWGFVESRLKEQGESYIQFVNERNAGSRNPPFITVEEQRRRKAEGNSVSYRRLEVSGLKDWAMCIHYGQYAWINDVLRKRMLELGLPLENFSLEYILDQVQEKFEPIWEVMPSAKPEVSTESRTPTGGITQPVDLGGGDGRHDVPHDLRRGKTYPARTVLADDGRNC